MASQRRPIRAAHAGLFVKRAQRVTELRVRSAGPQRACPLTGREMSVLAKVAEGHSNRSVAFELAISEQTVKNHLSQVLRKLSVLDRTAAVITALQKGWLHLGSVIPMRAEIRAGSGWRRPAVRIGDTDDPTGGNGHMALK